MLTLPESFARFISPEPMSGCWIWTGGLDKDGYALGYRPSPAKPHTVRAHRAIYKLLVGPLSSALTLDHLCRTRCCVNPDHLEPVTNKLNIMRGEGWAAKNARKLVCAKGQHSLEDAYINPKNQRICRICSAESQARYRERKHLGKI